MKDAPLLPEFEDAAPPAADAPLAERLRPRAADEFFGQRHLLAAGAPLQKMLAGGALHSFLLWGPPGSGKTTLARMIGAAHHAAWFSLSAVTAGVREVREVVAEAKRLRNAQAKKARLLFVDEVHRFNKAQQDAFLPFVEEGLFVFIGATTENPSFEVNAALLSRLAVYPLHALDDEAMRQVMRRTLAAAKLSADEAAAAALCAAADGDARRLINLIERANADGALTAAAVAKAGEKLRRFDKGGDVFYQQISALHKSVRGSDPDAALYWLARMLDGGAEPLYVSRRLVRMAAEDIGLADARALQIALAADAGFRQLGSPEGELFLAQAAVYLACAPKSDSVYRAFSKMREAVKSGGALPVPRHLCNAPTRMMREMGYGANYRHAHDEGGYAAGEQYFPDGMQPLRFYRPAPRGDEKQIGEWLRSLRAQDESHAKRARTSPPKPAVR